MDAVASKYCKIPEAEKRGLLVHNMLQSSNGSVQIRTVGAEIVLKSYRTDKVSHRTDSVADPI